METLLFLDEIQAAPHLFAKLRYFHEQVPALHVIAAGSFLEFALEKHEFSMTVGRIEYLHLGPITFDEFLIALGHKDLADFISTAGPGTKMPPPFACSQWLECAIRSFIPTVTVYRWEQVRMSSDSNCCSLTWGFCAAPAA